MSFAKSKDSISADSRQAVTYEDASALLDTVETAISDLFRDVDEPILKIDVEAKDVDDAVKKIRKEVEDCINKLPASYTGAGVTRDMARQCIESAEAIIKEFAAENDEGVVQRSSIIQYQEGLPSTSSAQSEWRSNCQVGVEIDADGPNARQREHIGAEVYLARCGQCSRVMEEPWRRGSRELKVHAYLPAGTLKYYRHMDESAEKKESAQHDKRVERKKVQARYHIEEETKKYDK